MVFLPVKFFPFLNIIAVIVLVGICADDVFIYFDAFRVHSSVGWNCMKPTRLIQSQKSKFPWALECESERESEQMYAAERASKASSAEHIVWVTGARERANGGENGIVIYASMSFYPPWVPF